MFVDRPITQAYCVRAQSNCSGPSIIMASASSQNKRRRLWEKRFGLQKTRYSACSLCSATFAIWQGTIVSTSPPLFVLVSLIMPRSFRQQYEHHPLHRVLTHRPGHNTVLGMRDLMQQTFSLPSHSLKSPRALSVHHQGLGECAIRSDPAWK